MENGDPHGSETRLCMRRVKVLTAIKSIRGIVANCLLYEVASPRMFAHKISNIVNHA